MDNTINEGDQVILKKDENVKLFTIRKKRQVYMEKIKFSFCGAIGHPYGSMFEVKDFQLTKVERETSSLDKDAQMTADNRDLRDVSSNQKLSRDDIEEMKDQGVEGEKIIEKLVEHSNTFENKTEFSKAKYLKKKKKKFMKMFTILKPTTRLLCEMHYNKGRSKILGLRLDSVSQILSYGNVRSGSNLILQESCSGLLLGAILKRLGDEGMVIDFYSGSSPPRPEAPDFSKEYYKEHVYSLPLETIKGLVDILEGRAVDTKEEVVGTKTDSDVKGQEASEESSAVKSGNGEVDGEGHSAEPGCSGDVSKPERTKGEMDDKVEGAKEEKMDTGTVSDDGNKDGKQVLGQEQHEGKNPKRKEQFKLDYEKRRAFKQERIKEASDLVVKGNYDGLIVASKFHPAPIVMNLMKFVAPSRPIIVYSQFQEPLIDLYKKLREQGNVLNLTLSETWLREYQVLPMRTHPNINMSGTGGFLLTGIKVMAD